MKCPVHNLEMELTEVTRNQADRSFPVIENRQHQPIGHTGFVSIKVTRFKKRDVSDDDFTYTCPHMCTFRTKETPAINLTGNEAEKGES